MNGLIRYIDQPAMPWKNGGGVTVELLCDPRGAGMEEFVYRISVASISKDGPFSSFPGVDRTLALVDGEGVTLDLDGRSQRVDADHPMIAFPGEAKVHATVNAGTTLDFNVMTRRRHCRHEVEVVEMGMPRTFKPKGDVTVLFFARGDRLRVGQFEPKGEMITLAERDAVILDPNCTYTIVGFSTVSYIVDIYFESCTIS